MIVLALKRRFTKSGHVVNVQDLTSCSNHTTNGGMATYANLLRTQLSDVQKRLVEWNSPDKIDNVEFLELMEHYINNSLRQVQIQKDNLRERNSSSHLECCTKEQKLFKVPNMNQQSMGSLASSSSEDSNSHPKREVWPNQNDSFANLDYGVAKELIKTESISFPPFAPTVDNSEMLFPAESLTQHPYRENNSNLPTSLEIPQTDMLQPYLGYDHNCDSSATTGHSNYHPSTFNCYNQFYSLDEYSWPGGLTTTSNDYGAQTG